TSGALTIADVDAGQSNFTAQASTPGSNGFGTFTLAANGAWTYTANNSLPAIQQLNASQALPDRITAVSSHGTASRVVTVRLHATHAVPLIGGATPADMPDLSLHDALPIFTSGALTIADVDAGQSNFTAQASTPGSNGFGTFTLAANGAWTYTANNSQAAI